VNNQSFSVKLFWARLRVREIEREDIEIREREISQRRTEFDLIVWWEHGRRSNRRLCEWVPQAERVCAKRWPTSNFQHRFLSSTRHSQSCSVFTLSFYFVSIFLFNLCQIAVLHHLSVAMSLNLNPPAYEDYVCYQSLKLDIKSHSVSVTRETIIIRTPICQEF